MLFTMILAQHYASMEDLYMAMYIGTLLRSVMYHSLILLPNPSS